MKIYQQRLWVILQKSTKTFGSALKTKNISEGEKKCKLDVNKSCQNSKRLKQCSLVML